MRHDYEPTHRNGAVMAIGIIFLGIFWGVVLLFAGTVIAALIRLFIWVVTGA